MVSIRKTSAQPYSPNNQKTHSGLKLGTGCAVVSGATVFGVVPKLATLKPIAIAAPFFIGAGAIVDHMNNRQRAKSEPNAQTKNGNEYVKTNMGKKLGGFLGLACESGIIALNRVLKTGEHFNNPLATIVTAVIGGTILGAIADKMSNRKAAKAADKNA